MPENTNLMDSLMFLQQALDARTVQMKRCEIYPAVQVLVDEPNGDLRLTYAKVIAGNVQSIAVFVQTESVGRNARFSLGFAVHESTRRKRARSRSCCARSAGFVCVRLPVFFETRSLWDEPEYDGVPHDCADIRKAFR